MKEKMKSLINLYTYRDDLIRAKNKLRWYQFKKRRDFNIDIKKYKDDIEVIFEEEILKY